MLKNKIFISSCIRQFANKLLLKFPLFRGYSQLQFQNLRDEQERNSWTILCSVEDLLQTYCKQLIANLRMWAIRSTERRDSARIDEKFPSVMNLLKKFNC